MTGRRALAEAKNRRVKAIVADVLAAVDDLGRDINRLRAELRKVDRRDGQSRT